MAISYTGPYGNMFGYILGAGAPVGMPAGSNNQNAFFLGLSNLLYADATMGRRGVAVYSNLTNVGVGALFSVRTSGVSGNVAAPARIGPCPAFFPNRNGLGGGIKTSPY